MQHKGDVVIVGAGMAELTAATELEQNGYNEIVLDKDHGAGGHLASRRIGLATFDQAHSMAILSAMLNMVSCSHPEGCCGRSASPLNMYTVMFAIGRMPGWIANWQEMHEHKLRISRPRQIYTGKTARPSVPLAER